MSATWKNIDMLNVFPLFPQDGFIWQKRLFCKKSHLGLFSSLDHYLDFWDALAASGLQTPYAVDYSLAELFFTAYRVREEADDDHKHLVTRRETVFPLCGQLCEWSQCLGSDVIFELMANIAWARHLFIRKTEMVQLTSKELKYACFSQLARAVDRFFDWKVMPEPQEYWQGRDPEEALEVLEWITKGKSATWEMIRPYNESDDELPLVRACARRNLSDILSRCPTQTCYLDDNHDNGFASEAGAYHETTDEGDSDYIPGRKGSPTSNRARHRNSPRKPNTQGNRRSALTTRRTVNVSYDERPTKRLKTSSGVPNVVYSNVCTRARASQLRAIITNQHDLHDIFNSSSTKTGPVSAKSSSSKAASTRKSKRKERSKDRQQLKESRASSQMTLASETPSTETDNQRYTRLKARMLEQFKPSFMEACNQRSTRFQTGKAIAFETASTLSNRTSAKQRSKAQQTRQSCRTKQTSPQPPESDSIRFKSPPIEEEPGIFSRRDLNAPSPHPVPNQAHFDGKKFQISSSLNLRSPMSSLVPEVAQSSVKKRKTSPLVKSNVLPSTCLQVKVHAAEMEVQLSSPSGLISALPLSVPETFEPTGTTSVVSAVKTIGCVPSSDVSPLAPRRHSPIFNTNHIQTTMQITHCHDDGSIISILRHNGSRLDHATSSICYPTYTRLRQHVSMAINLRPQEADRATTTRIEGTPVMVQAPPIRTLTPPLRCMK